MSIHAVSSVENMYYVEKDKWHAIQFPQDSYKYSN